MINTKIPAANATNVEKPQELSTAKAAGEVRNDTSAKKSSQAHDVDRMAAGSGLSPAAAPGRPSLADGLQAPGKAPVVGANRSAEAAEMSPPGRDEAIAAMALADAIMEHGRIDGSQANSVLAAMINMANQLTVEAKADSEDADVFSARGLDLESRLMVAAQLRQMLNLAPEAAQNGEISNDEHSALLDAARTLSYELLRSVQGDDGAKAAQLRQMASDMYIEQVAPDSVLV